MPERFIAITTDDKVALLQRAWLDATADLNSMLPLLEQRLKDAQDLSDEDLNSSSSNGHAASTNYPGTNTATDTEYVRAWTDIITTWRDVREFLQYCSDYALDAWTQFLQGYLPQYTTPATANPAITIDSTGQWLRAARYLDIDPALIINAAVGDEAIFAWIMKHPLLLNRSQNNTESRGDYSQTIIGRAGGGWWI